MRERIFNNVDLPLPLGPMIPRTSPAFTSKLMFFNAHNVSLWRVRVRRDFRGERQVSCSFWRRELAGCTAASRYCLLNPSTLTIGFMDLPGLDDVRKRPFHSSKQDRGVNQQRGRHDRRYSQQFPVEGLLPQQRRAKRIEDPSQRI